MNASPSPSPQPVKSALDGFVFSTVVSLLAIHSPIKAEVFRNNFSLQRNGTIPEQIGHMNRYWHAELAAVDNRAHTSSIAARECLRDDLGFEDWCRHFASTVLPVIVSAW
jgi:hypothetical protein